MLGSFLHFLPQVFPFCSPISLLAIFLQKFACDPSLPRVNALFPHTPRTGASWKRRVGARAALMLGAGEREGLEQDTHSFDGAGWMDGGAAGIYPVPVTPFLLPAALAKPC